MTAGDKCRVTAKLLFDRVVHGVFDFALHLLRIALGFASCALGLGRWAVGRLANCLLCLTGEFVGLAFDL
jgi:hypothetical protein